MLWQLAGADAGHVRRHRPPPRGGGGGWTPKPVRPRARKGPRKIFRGFLNCRDGADLDQSELVASFI
jgi:hypothetical protein